MTPAVKWLIIANAVMFVATLVYPPIIQYLGLSPELVVERQWLWQLVTYLFLHGSAVHILLNMLGIWMFGVELERLWGTRQFVKYYAITGIGAGLTVMAVGLLPLDWAVQTYRGVTIGASGALYGLLVAFAFYYPDRPLLMFFLFPIPAKYFVMIVGAMAFLAAPQSRVSESAASRWAGDWLPVPARRPRRADGGNQVPLSQVEDESPAPQVRRLFGRPVRLGSPRPLGRSVGVVRWPAVSGDVGQTDRRYAAPPWGESRRARPGSVPRDPTRPPQRAESPASLPPPCPEAKSVAPHPHR